MGGIIVSVLFCLLCLPRLADAVTPGRNKVVVRGQSQDIYYFPGQGSGPHRKVLFAPGDGGWRGFANDVAENLQAAGYDVYGLDTRRYLTSFTGKTVLTPSDVAGDMRQLAEWMRQGSAERILLAGWSEGAGLGLAAASDASNRSVFAGLVAIGMTPRNILAWRYSDLWAEIARKLPNEPIFSSADYIGKVSPLPLFIIASEHDEYTSPEEARQMASLAREPKQFVIVDAKDHKYAGNTEVFFQTLRHALTWVAEQQR
jgi:pimeloyl-ACP methyl ester carboxylesterase